MKSGKLLLIVMAFVTVCTVVGCSDDDDPNYDDNGVYHINFGEQQVAGSWRLTRVDTVERQSDSNMKVISSAQPANVRVNFTAPNYNVTQSDSTLQIGTYSVGTMVIYLSHDNARDTLTVLNADAGNGQYLYLQHHLQGTTRVRYSLYR